MENEGRGRYLDSDLGNIYQYMYTSNALKSFSKMHLGMKFSTIDNDNDLSDNYNCAAKHTSG